MELITFVWIYDIIVPIWIIALYIYVRGSPVIGSPDIVVCGVVVWARVVKRIVHFIPTQLVDDFLVVVRWRSSNWPKVRCRCMAASSRPSVSTSSQVVSVNFNNVVLVYGNNVPGVDVLLLYGFPLSLLAPNADVSPIGALDFHELRR